MNLLLDTHIIIWALNDDPALSEQARAYILDPDNRIYYSVVSVWEVLLKHSRRPDAIPFDEHDFCDGCRAAGFIPLHLTEKHILSVRSLTRPSDAKEHHDPFDRLLLSQAKTEGFFLMTHDTLLPDYEERCILSV